MTDRTVNAYSVVQLAPMYGLYVLDKMNGVHSAIHTSVSLLIQGAEIDMTQYHDYITSLRKSWTVCLVKGEESHLVLVTIVDLLTYATRIAMPMNSETLSVFTAIINAIILLELKDVEIAALREIQHRLYLHNITPSFGPLTQTSTLLRLCHKFVLIPLSNKSTLSLKQVFARLEVYESDSFIQIHKEATLACEYLTTLPRAQARWFRETGRRESIKELQSLGIEQYLVENGDQINPIVIANYLKIIIRKTEAGLIPEPVQSVFNDLIHAEMSVEKVECVRCLLSIGKERSDLIQKLTSICARILNESEDSINPEALASIVPVSDEGEIIETLDKYLLKSNGKIWARTFGLIMANQSVFV